MKAIDRKAPTIPVVASATTRRQFCQAAALGALGVVAAACGGSNPAGPSSTSALPIVNGTAGSGVITVTVDSTSPLATVGNAALVQAGGAAVLVARTAQNTFAAVSALCTHQGCEITAYSGSSYVCPCHGAQFSTSGQVMSGPAPTNLATYPTQFAGNVLTIG